MPSASESSAGSSAGAEISPPAIRVQDLSISFRTSLEGDQTLAKVIGRRRKRKTAHTIDAVRNVSFDVASGSVMGLVGRNGSGKSTTLRALAGVFAPTGGRIELNGRVSPLLALGVGFNQRLTGRDNIMLGGLANGLEPDQIESRRDEIIEFSGLGEAIDRPVRTYSNGMFTRLGFAVATHLEPEILLIDEVLAAGDATFKLRSAAKIKELCANDTTVVLVSHALGVIHGLADQCVWLQDGQVEQLGPTEEVLEHYVAEHGLDAATAMTAIMEDL